jgi:hypothetical protein
MTEAAPNRAAFFHGREQAPEAQIVLAPGNG